MSTPQAQTSDDIHETAFAKRRCCFCFPFILTGEPPSSPTSTSVFWQRINPLESSNPTTSAAGNGEAWWERGWKKMRDWSETVAGPRWKTLIRKIGKKRRNVYGYENSKFRYDPLSYALNFDEGPGQNGHYDEDLVGRGFSSRYSLPPSCKSSIDFDREGIVVFPNDTSARS